jgi:hypothetical protein
MKKTQWSKIELPSAEDVVPKKEWRKIPVGSKVVAEMNDGGVIIGEFNALNEIAISLSTFAYLAHDKIKNLWVVEFPPSKKDLVADDIRKVIQRRFQHMSDRDAGKLGLTILEDLVSKGLIDIPDFGWEADEPTEMETDRWDAITDILSNYKVRNINANWLLTELSAHGWAVVPKNYVKDGYVS